MVTKPLFGAFLFAAVASASAGTADSISYAGVTLGATVEEYAAKLPDHRCRPAEGVCRFVLDQCHRAKPGRPPNDCATRNAFLGAQVRTATADFRENQLVSLSFTLEPAQVGHLAKALEEQFGPPASAGAGQSGRGGAAQPSPGGRVWSRPDDWEMRIEQSSGRPASGLARLTAAKELERQNAARAGSNRPPASKGS